MSSSPQPNEPALCSVLCITYNHCEFATDALHSVFRQDYPNIEVIVLDDGSTDGTGEIVRETLATSPFPSRLIEQENSGNVASNLNRARARASGKVLLILSLDDMLEEGMVSSLMAAFAQDKKLALCACTLLTEIDEEGQVVRAEKPTPVDALQDPVVDDLIECEFENIGAFFVQNAAFDADVFDAVGGCDEDMTGDDIILRTKVFHHLRKHPDATAKLLRRVGFRYRAHGNNLHKNTLRQIVTVVEWRNRYFADRALPPLLTGWIKYHIYKSVWLGDWDAVKALDALDPEVAAISAEISPRGVRAAFRCLALGSAAIRVVAKKISGR